MPFPGYIAWCKSNATGKEFPVLVFAADVDYATSGMASLTSRDRHEVVATIATLEEDADHAALQRRVNSGLQRTDLCFSEFLRVNDPHSFGDRETVYSDIYNDGGEALMTRQQGLDEFTRSGGTFTKYQFGEDSGDTLPQRSSWWKRLVAEFRP